jgi:hypothetical protein
MKPKEIQKRDPKDENLRVLQTEDGSYFVESTEGKILYNVGLNESEKSCTCSDFANNAKKNSEFQCKHILAVLNCVSNGDIVDGRFLEKPKPKLDERFIITIEGQDFVKFQGLLDLGHQKGISQIDVEPLQLPTSDNGNFAICKATVVSKSGESFTDIGDANPGNCSSKVVKHLLRLASTRAIARALRTFTNIGITCLEELGDDVVGSNPNGNNHGGGTNTADRGGNKTSGRGGKQTAKSKNGKGKQPEPKPKADGRKATKSDSKGTKKAYPPMSEAQKRAIENLARRRGVTENQELNSKVMDTYGCPFEDLSAPQASELIRNLQQNA